MSWKVTKLIVFVYLIGAAAVSIHALYGLWRLDPSALVASGGRGPFPTPTRSRRVHPRSGTSSPPAWNSAERHRRSRSTATTSTQTSKVRLNGVESRTAVRRRARARRDAHRLRYGDADDAVGGGRPDQGRHSSRSGGRGLQRRRSPDRTGVRQWVVFWTEATFSLEVRLMLLVLFMGAFAASIYAIKSFVDYAGEETLTASWCWLYFARPIMGSGLAFVFYLVVRAGFLASTAPMRRQSIRSASSPWRPWSACSPTRPSSNSATCSTPCSSRPTHDPTSCRVCPSP